MQWWCMNVRDEKSSPYLRDRRIVNRESYVVIFSDDISVIPLCCPVCDLALRTRSDEDEFSRLGCCHDCATLWAYPNVKRWKEGWRPSVNEISQQPRGTIEFAVKLG